MILKFLIAAILIIIIGKIIEDKQWTRSKELEIKRLEDIIYIEEHPEKEEALKDIYSRVNSIFINKEKVNELKSAKTRPRYTYSIPASLGMSIINFGKGLFIASLIIGGFYSIFLMSALSTREELNVYTEQNKEIGSKLKTTLDNYLEHENEVFKGSKNDDAIYLISLYLELKSDKLVKEQIKVYIDNNDEIKSKKASVAKIGFYERILYK